PRHAGQRRVRARPHPSHEQMDPRSGGSPQHAREPPGVGQRSGRAQERRADAGDEALAPGPRHVNRLSRDAPLRTMKKSTRVVPPETFNRLFTMHGTTMIFLVGIPIVFGFGNYLVPLMIGARDLAFPRLNAFGFWVLLFGGLLLHFSVIGGDGLYGAGSAPAVGWFAYAPLTGRAFTPGNATDYWNLAILVTGVGTIATAVNLVATTLTMRGPGMTLG